MPRPGIHLPLRNMPIHILSKSFVASDNHDSSPASLWRKLGTKIRPSTLHSRALHVRCERM
jgi:hypothetical protein